MVVLSFDQIESLVGLELPESARSLQGWWATTDDQPALSPWAAAWRLAGRTATPNLLARTVAFERTVSP
jgi:hypothetical protein